jgi:secondary thiamine-phosphate synthase enzyme
MDMLAAATTCSHMEFLVATARPTEFVDLTERIDAFVRQTGMSFGIVNIQSLHTTAGIVANEHEPLLLADFDGLLSRIAPLAGGYEHDDASRRTVNLSPGEPANGHAHCRALLLPSSMSVNVVNGRLRIGRWQRIFLVELDGPRRRQVSVVAFGTSDAPRSDWKRR